MEQKPTSLTALEQKRLKKEFSRLDKEIPIAKAVVEKLLREKMDIAVKLNYWKKQGG